MIVAVKEYYSQIKLSGRIEMRKIKSGLIGILLLASLALGGATCTPAEQQLLYFLLGYFSYPTVYITKDGSANFANVIDPVTGTDVTNATVTVKNESTGLKMRAQERNRC